MQQATSYTRWRRWRHALLFGVPLGLIELGLLVLTLTHPAQLSSGQAILLDYLLAFLVPTVAGYLFCFRRQHEGWESGWAGLRVGLVACVVFLLATAIDFAVALIIYDNTPPPPPPPTNPREIYSPGLALVLDVILFGFLALLSSLSLFVSAAGGRIGGALAIWRAKRLQLQEQHL